MYIQLLLYYSNKYLTVKHYIFILTIVYNTNTHRVHIL